VRAGREQAGVTAAVAAAVAVFRVPHATTTPPDALIVVLRVGVVVRVEHG
jgi:hypothetical protein